MRIPARLGRLLELVAKSDTPVPVRELAEKLGVSRRTVFRELENVESLLAPFEVAITAAAGGITMTGTHSAKLALLDAVSSAAPDPADKRDRVSRLMAELLREREVQKIYYYAARFKVSEGTISRDLDAAKEQLRQFGLMLVRRPGLGVAVDGAEQDFRRALIALLEQSEAAQSGDFPEALLYNQACELLDGLHAQRIEQMAGESRTRLALYIAVSAQRISDGRVIGAAANDENRAAAGSLAQRLADAIEQRFGITMPEHERSFLQSLLSGARMRYIDRAGELALLDDFGLQSLACRMIDGFDPELSYELKSDEALVHGLSFHLRSAVVRLQNGFQLRDPFSEEMEQRYPEVFTKSKRAALVLQQEYGAKVSDSEAGFLSMHFGAALMRLRERKTHRRTVKILVLCENGIGVSYMVASQIKSRFQDRVEVEACMDDEIESAGQYDFCVCASPTGGGSSPVRTGTILSAGDFERIEQRINACAEKAPPASHEPDAGLLNAANRLEWMARDIRSILTRFQVVSVDADCSFEELVKLAGYRFGDSPESGGLIYRSLMDRERIATQVVPSYGFVLLHSRTRGTSEPLFALLCPDSPPFKDPYLRGAMSAVVMLAPADSSAERGGLMGAISSALVENESFLEAVRSGNAECVRVGLDTILRVYLSENIRKLS